MGKTALVIIHLSSLDSYTQQSREAGDQLHGDLLADTLIVEIDKHKGPVYIVDQGWDVGRWESRPRVRVLNSLKHRVTWVKFDEAVDNWEEFEDRLVRLLKKDGVSKVILGGLWYDSTMQSGCVTESYLRLSRHFDVQVNERIVGCESDFDVEWDRE